MEGERCRAPDLILGLFGIGIVLEEEERVEVQNDGCFGGEVGVIPEFFNIASDGIGGAIALGVVLLEDFLEFCPVLELEFADCFFCFFELGFGEKGLDCG